MKLFLYCLLAMLCMAERVSAQSVQVQSVDCPFGSANCFLSIEPVVTEYRYSPLPDLTNTPIPPNATKTYEWTVTGGAVQNSSGSTTEEIVRIKSLSENRESYSTLLK
jgi:hypothetical protein